MKNHTFISIQDICSYYNISASFIDELSNYELIQIYEENNVKHLNADEINTIEKLIRLHFELDVNFEGLDVILNLLDKINNLQSELNSLKNELNFYKK